MTSAAPRSLTVIYDDRCALCRRAARWMLRQPAWVPIEAIPMSATETRRRFPQITYRLERDQFVVVDDAGGVYADTDARILVLWALCDWRRLALRLSRSGWRELAARIFDGIARNRYRMSRLLPGKSVAVPAHNGCDDGACRVEPGEVA